MKIDFKQIAAKENEIIRLLIKNGAYPYLVGGTVRDLLLYGEIKKLDFDVEVYGLSLSELIAVFEKENISFTLQGNFGVIKVDGCNLELAIPRLENKIGKKHSDFIINLDPFMKPSDAIVRRDFTINTLMYDLVTNHLVENKRAIEDLTERRIRHVSAKFSEDPLRILRAIRFSVCHNLEICDETLLECQQIIDQLKYISSERIDAELNRIVTADYLNERREYLNLFFIDFLKFDFKIEEIHFSNNLYINLALIAINLSEQELNLFLKYILNKRTKKLVKYLVKNYSINLLDLKILYNHADNLEFITLLTDMQFFLKQISNSDIQIIEKCISEINSLKKQYNGHYFIEKGILPKDIKQEQKRLILKKIQICEI